MAKGKKSLKLVESQLKVVLEAPRYKMIPVDLQTYERLVSLCQAQGRKQGAQVKVWVDADYEKLLKVEEEEAAKVDPPVVKEELMAET